MFQDLSVLVVDDDALILMNAVDMLEDLGLEVAEAASGEQALAIMSSKPIDVLITDLSMPRMTGMALAEAVREKYPETSIILATGYSDVPVGDTGIRRLPKPYTQSDLENAIKVAVAKV